METELTETKFELTKYNAARRALAEAHRVDEVRQIRDKAVALEAYSRQAKDRDMEVWCAEIRLRAERRAGQLLAEMKESGERHRGHGDQKSDSKTTSPILTDLGITYDESSKWQKLAEISEKEFEAKIAEATTARDLGINAFLKTAFSSKSVEWNTPPEIIEKVKAVMRSIDLDPCADSAKSIQAVRHFTIEDDGLSQPWSGRVYMNPPYGDEIGEWVKKLLVQPDVSQFIALVPARTDTVWFRLFLPHDPIFCFIAGRLKFSGHQNGAPFPSAVIYCGPNKQSFAEQFGPMGLIMVEAYDWFIEGEDEENELGKPISGRRNAPA